MTKAAINEQIIIQAISAGYEREEEALGLFRLGKREEFLV